MPDAPLLAAQPTATATETTPATSPKPGETTATEPAKPAAAASTTTQEKDPKKPEGSKTPDKAPDANAPAEFEPKLPEGFEADKHVLGAVKTWVKEHGVKSEVAQALFDSYVKADKQSMDEFRAQTEQKINGWQEQIKKHPEFGGEKFKESKAAADRAVEKFGSPALQKLLGDPLIGNRPELFEFVAKIGKAISEDRLAGTVTTTPAKPSKEDELRATYPSMFPKEQ